MNICPSCRSSLPIDAGACPACGAARSADTQAVSPKTRQIGPRTEPLGPPTRDLADPPTAAVPTSVLPGRIAPGTVLLERYRVAAFLGAGGMGEVYQADDLTLREPTALKFPYPDLVRSVAGRETFYSEARTARLVTSPYVCRVHDIHEVADPGTGRGLGSSSPIRRPFLSMELLSGTSLHDRIRTGGRLPTELALRVARQLCSGLEAIHAKDILHRDLKPANVQLNESDQVKITDFGLAALAAEASVDRELMGTLQYMAPEQLFGNGEVSVSSDLYSLGLVLYEVFTGQAAFDGTSSREVGEQQLHGPISPSALNPLLDPVLEEILQRCLDIRPDRRPTSARELYETLAGLGNNPVEGLPSASPSIDVLAGYTPPAQRRRLVADPVPFVSGRRADGDAFLGREAQLSTLFSRLYQGESTTLVGPWGSGKSSLLYKLAETSTQHAYLGDQAERMTFHRLDLHTLSSDFDPASFWDECLEPLAERPGDPRTRELLSSAEHAGYRRHRITRLFDHLDENGWRLVLLLDEIEHLIVHPSFGPETAFFALLRSLATGSSLVVVSASRLNVHQLNRLCLSEAGSPFFNHMIDVVLSPFDDTFTEALLDLAGSAFSPLDRRFVGAVAGRYPFLLQALGAALYTAEGEGMERRALAARRFTDQAGVFFDFLWRWDGLGDRDRTLLILLALEELTGQPQAFAPNEVRFELERLAEIGLAERVGKRWRPALAALVWWVWETAVKASREVPGWDTWREQESYSMVLDRTRWNDLLAAAQARPIASLEDIVRVTVSHFAETSETSIPKDSP